MKRIAKVKGSNRIYEVESIHFPKDGSSAKVTCYGEVDFVRERAGQAQIRHERDFIYFAMNEVEIEKVARITVEMARAMYDQGIQACRARGQMIVRKNSRKNNVRNVDYGQVKNFPENGEIIFAGIKAAIEFKSEESALRIAENFHQEQGFFARYCSDFALEIAMKAEEEGMEALSEKMFEIASRFDG